MGNGRQIGWRQGKKLLSEILVLDGSTKHRSVAMKI
jgi:hypothetical protein